ncbi:MAG: ATP-binding protein [Acidobacteriota bacterium]
MNRSNPKPDPTGPTPRMRIEGGAQLSRTILHIAHESRSRMEFLRDVSEVLLQFFACDALEIRLHDNDLHFRWEASVSPRKNFRLSLVQWQKGEDGTVIPALKDGSDLEHLCAGVARQDHDSTRPFYTRNGSFWTGDTWESFILDEQTDRQPANGRRCVGGHYRSLAIMRFMVDEKTTGLLHIKSEKPDCFTESEIEFCEEMAQALGLATADRRAQAALRERIKELTCLYGIAQIIEDPGSSVAGAMQQIVELLPPSWQYSEIAAARITLDANSYVSANFQSGVYLQAADIVIKGARRGLVEVSYYAERPELTLGVFLPEEEKLIKAVAREIALFIERREAEADKKQLNEQLIHADRLATVGQLAAGVAHEINEPLASILGYGQLASKHENLPQPAAEDLERIITAALYAREVIKNLMVFSRQMPARMSRIDLNQVVEEALYFLESRCRQQDIQLVRALSPETPTIVADPSQLKQILVNLVVNAIHAMPQGGVLAIGTRLDSESVVLSVADSGTGIPEEIVDKIFLPFFTTKDVDEGTGLGLAVVHGIVTVHGGSITTESQLDAGTRFEIRLPVAGPADIQEADRQ